MSRWESVKTVGREWEGSEERVGVEWGENGERVATEMLG